MKRLPSIKRVLLACVLVALIVPALLTATASAAPAVHVVTDVSLAPRNPNVLQLGQRVTVRFSYVSPEPTGVRIFVRPMTAGALTPNYGAHGSPVYPAGSGPASGWFTITKGNVTVDHIRLQMWNAAQTVRLAEVQIPVHYRFTSATGNVIHTLSMTATPNVLQQRQRVSVSFRYRAKRSAGVRFYVRPLTGSRLTPGYKANAARLQPTGSGTSKGWFTVTRGTPRVTKVRVTMMNAARTKVLSKAVVPMYYLFKKPTNVVRSIRLTPLNPNVRRLGQDIGVTFRYSTSETGGVRIFARPMTAGVPTPNYGAHGSPVYPMGSGSAGGWFTINDVGATVDQIRIRMTNADQSTTLYEVVLPVSFQLM